MLLLVIYWTVARVSEIDTPYEEYLLAILISLKGTISFRIFDGTRYYYRLVKNSLLSIRYFLVVFAYSTLFFTVLLYIISCNNEKSIIEIWQRIWALNFTGEAENNYSTSEILSYLTIFSATILNLILMLNLLISILGDSYDLFMIEKMVYDLKEKIDFSLEIQTTLFWKKQYNQSKYFYVLSKAFDDGGENASADWQGKIVFLEKRQEKNIDNLKQNTNELKDIINGKDFKVKLSEIQVSMDQKISGVEKIIDNKISGVDNKIIEVEQKINGLEQKMNEVDQKISGVEGFIKEILDIMKKNK